MQVRENELPNMPDIMKEICLLFMAKHKKATPRMILNMIISKMAFSITSKRIQYKEYQNIGFPNWYAIIFAPSGCGKDRINKELDNNIFASFKEWFETQAKEYEKIEIIKIKDEANIKFSGNSAKKRQKYIDEEIAKLRPLVLEVYNGTAEGLFEEAKVRRNCRFGAIFLKISEFSKYFLNSKTEDKQFFSMLYNAYDAKIPSKCTKSDKRENDIENVPFNCLLMCDYSLFEQPKTRKELMYEFQTGFARRAVISFIPSIKFEIDNDIEHSFNIDNTFAQKAKIISEKFETIFSNLVKNTIYIIPDEVLIKLKLYKNKLYTLANDCEKEIYKKEILDRELKAIKLATIFAVLNQSNNIVTLTDLTQAIEVIEYLSIDFKKFIGYKPKVTDGLDELFNFLKDNLNTKYNKMQLVSKANDFGYSKNKFRENFSNIISKLKEMVRYYGYELFENKINNNTGMEYWLLKVNNDDILHTPLDKVIIG